MSERGHIGGLAALPLLAFALAAACSSTACYDNQSAIPLAEFRDKETDKAVTVSGVEVYGIGAPGDSLLYTGTSTSQVYLPMRSSAQSVTWCFHYRQEGLDSVIYNDTISFSYGSRPWFASEECGAMYVYDIRRMSYTRNVIDSMAILDSLITNVDDPRIAIYFKTADEGEDEQ